MISGQEIGMTTMMSNKPVAQNDIDPFDEGVILDPYAMHARLRDAGPVSFLPKYNSYAVARYDGVKQVLNDWESFTSTAGAGLADIRRPDAWRQPGPLVEADPPIHSQIRSVTQKIISPKVVKGWQEDFRAGAVDLVDRLCARSEVDGAKDIAEAFVMEVFPKSLGLEAHPRNMVIVGDFNFNALGPKNRLFEKSANELESIRDWFEAAQDRSGVVPGSFGDQVYQAEDRGELAEGVARGLVRTILRGGMDTTISGLGTSLMHLAQRPGLWSDLRQDRSKLKTIFDESIRVESPIQSYYRTTTRPVEIDGVLLEADVKVQIFVGSANRDPRQWAEPDQFDPSRRMGGHLAFGGGIHVCIGQIIARMEAEALFNAMLDRIERIELTGEPAYRPVNTLRTLDSLPLKLSP
jgi:cytochrome P450